MMQNFTTLTRTSQLEAGTQHDYETNELIRNNPDGIPHGREFSLDKPGFMHPETAEFGSEIGTDDYTEDWCSEHKSLLSSGAGKVPVSKTRNTKELFSRISGAIANVRRRGHPQPRPNNSKPSPGFISSHNLRRRLAPMHHALRERDAPEVKKLAGLGFDINVKISRTRPLQYATMRDDIDMVRMLISLGADVNGLDEFGLSPLIAAIRQDNFKIARLLVLLGANVNANPRSGSIPLVTAIHRGNFEMVKLLVELGADIHAVFTYGWTPLTHAISSGSVEVVRFMVDHGVDVNHVAAGGMTPLDLALRLGRREREDSERSRRFKDIAAILSAKPDPGRSRPQAIDTVRLILEYDCSGGYETSKC